MSGVCGHFDAIMGEVPVPCAKSHPPIVNSKEDLAKLDPEIIEQFKILCPNLDPTGPLCCNTDQIENLVENVNNLPKALLSRCPSCFHNFASIVSIF